MQIDTQTYEVKVTFTYEAGVFEGDPDNRFILANLEKDDVEHILESRFSECDISEIEVLPVIKPGE